MIGIKTVAANLPNRINQQHYIEHYMLKVYNAGVRDGMIGETQEERKANLALAINKLIHERCKDAPHDIGLDIVNLIFEYVK